MRSAVKKHRGRGWVWGMVFMKQLLCVVIVRPASSSFLANEQNEAQISYLPKGAQ